MWSYTAGGLRWSYNQHDQGGVKIKDCKIEEPLYTYKLQWFYIIRMKMMVVQKAQWLSSWARKKNI